jgi:hypothetical protein
MRSTEINRSLSNLSLPQSKVIVIMFSVEDSKDERSKSLLASYSCLKHVHSVLFVRV